MYGSSWLCPRIKGVGDDGGEQTETRQFTRPLKSTLTSLFGVTVVAQWKKKGFLTERW